METGAEIPHLEERQAPDGKTYPASQSRREPVEAEPEPEEPPEDQEPRPSDFPQGELDDLSTHPPRREPAPKPEPPAQIHKPLEVPDTPRDHLLDLMAAIRAADKALRDALLAAHRVAKWDGETPTQQLRETLDEIDQALAADDLDTELQKLIGGNHD